jgi:hypothetical protein
MIMAEVDIAAIRARAPSANPGDLEDYVLTLCAEVERLRTREHGALSVERVCAILDVCGDMEFKGPDNTCAVLSRRVREIICG